MAKLRSPWKSPEINPGVKLVRKEPSRAIACKVDPRKVSIRACREELEACRK
jgi:hypothetical protein